MGDGGGLKRDTHTRARGILLYIILSIILIFCLFFCLLLDLLQNLGRGGGSKQIFRRTLRLVIRETDQANIVRGGGRVIIFGFYS